MPQFILTLKGRELKRLTVEKPQLTIGRDPDDDLHIENIGISRSHVKIRVTAQGDIFAMDNKSSNGTFINGERISGRHKLKDGDDIQLAKYVITYSASSGGRLDMNKLRANAREGVNRPPRSVGVAGQGTLSFSADEIKKLVDANPAKAKEETPDYSGMDPAERLLAEDAARREAAKQAQQVQKSPSGNNQVLIMGLAAVILLLLIILVLLLKR